MPCLRIFATALITLLPLALGAQGTAADVARDLERLARGERITGLPPADRVAPGTLTVLATEVIERTVVARGPIDVMGRVDGSVVSLGGNVRIRRGGVVTGDAIAVGGRVIVDGGEVRGEMRSMSALPLLAGASVAATPLSSGRRTLIALQVVACSFGLLLLIAFAIVLLAGRNLNEVVATVEARFARALLVGVVGQLLILPVLALLLVALTLSLIGILLIPFAVVAFVIAVCGLLTLGFIAVARVAGRALWQGAHHAERVRELGGIAVGMSLFFALWIIAALVTGAPIAHVVVRAAAMSATWAAVTLGLGAAILSRAGTHRRTASVSTPVELAAWQTPTPVAGVIAARRPIATTPGTR